MSARPAHRRWPGTRRAASAPAATCGRSRSGRSGCGRRARASTVAPAATAARCAPIAPFDALGVPTTARRPRVLNVMGFLRARRARGRTGRGSSSTSTPATRRCGAKLGLADLLAGHDRFVTVGANVGREDCAIPDCGVEWIHTPPPVDLDAWTPAPDERRARSRASRPGATRTAPSTSTASRTARACTSSASSSSCRALVDAEFELALDIDAAETRDLAALERNGWRLVDPRRAAGTPQAYRDYIRGSRAELLRRAADVRRDAQRLAVRSQRLLPRERQAGARAGHRPRRPLPGRRGAADVLDAGGGGRRRRGDRARLRAPQRRRARARGGVLRRARGARAAARAARRCRWGRSPHERAADAAATPPPVRRLNWGCGTQPEPGWINSDRKQAPGIDISCDIRDGPAARRRQHRLRGQHPRAAGGPLLRARAGAARAAPRAEAGRRAAARPAEPRARGRRLPPRRPRLVPDPRRGDEQPRRQADRAARLVRLLAHAVRAASSPRSCCAEPASRRSHQLASGRDREPVPDIVALDDRPLESFFVEAVR